VPRRVLAPVQFARGEQNELQRQQGEQAAGQARGIVQGQQPGEQMRRGRGDPVVERCVRVGLAGELRRQPVAVGEDVEGDPIEMASSCFQGSWPISPVKM
jgi:hypothetical protein